MSIFLLLNAHCFQLNMKQLKGELNTFFYRIACSKVIYFFFIYMKCLDRNSDFLYFFFRLIMFLEIQKLLSMTTMIKSGLHSQWFTARNQFTFQGRSSKCFWRFYCKTKCITFHLSVNFVLWLFYNMFDYYRCELHL